MTPAQVAHIMSLVNKLKRFSHPIDRHEAAEVVAEIEAALRDAPQAEGWVMVPVEPTQTMMQQGKHALYEESMGDFDASLLEIKATYRAMLAARPSAPTEAKPATQPEAVGERMEAGLKVFARRFGHIYWGAGEKDCPDEIKAPNGELFKLRCKKCGEDNPKSKWCSVDAAAPTETRPATQPICEGCGKTIPEHDALLRCKAEATQQASGEREVLPDYSGMSREALERHAQRMAQTMGDDRAWKFYRKHADGPMLPPSCLCCGQLPGEVAIKHLELPGIVVCKKCRDAALSTPAQQDAVDAEWYRELLNQALDALSTYQGFVDDAHILEGQWHWLDDVKTVEATIRAAISAKKVGA